MKKRRSFSTLTISHTVGLVIFAILCLVCIQAYMVYFGAEVSQRILRENTKKILLDMHHVIEEDSILSAQLIQLIWMDRSGLEAPPRLSDRVSSILQERIDSVLSNYGVFLTFDYALYQAKTREVILTSSENQVKLSDFEQHSERAGWRIKQVFGKGAYRIGLRYHSLYSYILWRLRFIVLTSVAIIALLTFSYYRIIRGWQHQKQVSSLKNDFINTLTHELKTPIFSISLLHKVIRQQTKEKIPHSLDKYLRLLENENRKLKDRIEKVLHISLIEENKLHLDLAVYDMHELVADATRTLEFMANQINGKLHYQLEAPNPYIRADKVHFVSLIHNLVDNAIKYSIREPQVNIRTYQVGEEVVVEVSDEGPGIPLQYQELVFEKFYRIPTGNLHSIKGMGLGLSYVKKIVEAHGARIKLQSREQEGSTFSIYFKCATYETDLYTAGRRR